MRRPEQRPDAVALDRLYIARALRRAEEDKARPLKERERLCLHLKSALVILLDGVEKRAG